jgi:hypothetical protein
VVVEEEPMLKILVHARSKKHGPILVKHVGVGSSSHHILKGRYLNPQRLKRGRRMRQLKPLSIVHRLHRVSHFLVCPSRPLLLHLDVMLAPTHAENEVDELLQRRSGSAWPVLLPASPPVRLVLTTCQTGDGLRVNLLLWQLGSILLKYSFLIARCLFK